jgi:N-acylneuraminate cytidylyltransferase
MNILAIIPARGGSKGIPRKNIQPLAGKPLLAYTIEHARATPAISRVVVSTDDAEIAAVAEQYGAGVIWRPAEISGDDATSESALLHALDHLRDSDGYEPDLVVFLQATSPLRQPDDIQKAIETLRQQGADSLLSAAPSHAFLWRLVDGQAEPVNYDYRQRPRRQERAPEYIENGSIYIFKPWVLREQSNRLGGKIALYVMDPLDSLQVDEPGDLALIEQVMASRRRQPPAPDLSQIRLLVLDFDGVLTDNRVLVDEEGKEAVWVSRSDGWGIARLKEAGIEVMVLSTEANPVVAARCRKLGIECIQSCVDKLASLYVIAAERSLQLSEIAYVGNDANDLPCLRVAGLPIAVKDAIAEVHQAARLKTISKGGHGAVREVCEWLLDAQRDGR